MIKNTFVLAFSFLILAGCSKNTAVKMHLSGEVYGLKKGTLYLGKIKDGRYSKLDSFAVQDNGKFKLIPQKKVERCTFYLLTDRKTKQSLFLEKTATLQSIPIWRNLFYKPKFLDPKTMKNGEATSK